jgi:hypothetical protein
MKLGMWAAALLVCAGPAALAHGASLGDAAKRERERRDKNKEQGIEVRVLDASDLAAAPSDGGKGTFNEGTTGGKTSPPEGAPPPSAPMTPSVPGAGSPLLPGATLLDPAPQAPRASDDYRRDSARNAVSSAYRSMASSAARLVKDAKEYQGGCTTGTASGSRCTTLARNLTRLATSLSDSMEAAEALAQAGRVTPGEVREIQERCGCDVDWSAAERLINQYRKR